MTPRSREDETRRQWNSSMPAPTKPMQRSGPLKPKKRSAKEKVRVNGPPGFSEWLHAQPCLVAGRKQHVCLGGIEAAHLLKDNQSGMGRKAGWQMQGPLCLGAHRLAHTIGHLSFQKVFDVSFVVEIQRIQALWNDRSFPKSDPSIGIGELCE
jgi:hypothetical protein